MIQRVQVWKCETRNCHTERIYGIEIEPSEGDRRAMLICPNCKKLARTDRQAHTWHRFDRLQFVDRCDVGMIQ